MTNDDRIADDDTKLVSLAVKLQILQRDLSPLGQRTAAMMLLCRIAKAAEAAPDPVHGESVIDDIADVARQNYRTLG